MFGFQFNILVKQYGLTKKHKRVKNTKFVLYGLNVINKGVKN